MIFRLFLVLASFKRSILELGLAAAMDRHHATFPAGVNYANEGCGSLRLIGRFAAMVCFSFSANGRSMSRIPHGAPI
jgi:hypothetical protein